ncbi:MAG: hypothetical protein GEU81_09125 [Nitriliruptorales bacterium]|nr:hypothetical protein [Nitriliruptorales bacterium]
MASDPTERKTDWTDETQRLDRPLDQEETAREVHDRTVMLEPEAVHDYGQTARADDRTLPEDEPTYGYDPEHERYQGQRGRWGTGVLIILALIALIAGILVGGLLTRPAQAPTGDEVVSRATLEEQQAQTAERDAQIAELQGRLDQIQQDRDTAGSGQEAALEERRAALDERQVALDERQEALDTREQALNEREQAADSDDPLPDVELPDVELPDVDLPDIGLPTEETRNLLERAVDQIREFFD